MIGGQIRTAQTAQSIIAQDKFAITTISGNTDVLKVVTPKQLVHRKLWLATGMSGAMSAAVIDAELQFMLNGDIVSRLPYRFNTGVAGKNIFIGNNSGWGSTSQSYAYDEGVFIDYNNQTVCSTPWRLKVTCDEIRLRVERATISTRWFGALIVMSSPLEV